MLDVIFKTNDPSGVDVEIERRRSQEEDEPHRDPGGEALGQIEPAIEREKNEATHRCGHCDRHAGPENIGLAVDQQITQQ